LLQPLDTHVFSALKHHLHTEQTAMRDTDAAGRLSRGSWIGLVSSAVDAILVKRSWAHAFHDNGLATAAYPKRRAIADAAGPLFPTTPRPPTTEELQFVVSRAVPNLAERALSRSRRMLHGGPGHAAEALPAAPPPPLPPPSLPPPDELEEY
jgi:hypothetical protein